MMVYCGVGMTATNDGSDIVCGRGCNFCADGLMCSFSLSCSFAGMMAISAWIDVVTAHPEG
eukprot:763003-Hanusia_phi.AAC.3